MNREDKKLYSQPLSPLETEPDNEQKLQSGLKPTVSRSTDGKASKKWLGFVVVVVLLMGAGISWWLVESHSRTVQLGTPVTAPSLEITQPSVTKEIKIGVIVSYTENSAEGSGWDHAGEGARVAQWRLQQGGTPVQLVVVSDQGSFDGAKDAINQLKESGVDAALALTSGPHTEALAQSAIQAQIPLTFPYQIAPDKPAAGTTYVMPDAAGVVATVRDELKNLQCENVIILAGTSQNLQTLDGVRIQVDPLNVEQSITQLLDLIGRNEQSRCLVVDADPEHSAHLIQAVRANNVSLPILGGPSLRNPLFEETLGANADAVGELYAIGAPSVDSIAQLDSGKGAQAGVFQRAVQIMTNDPTVKTLSEEEPFKTDAQFADIVSHDVLLQVVTRLAGQKQAPSGAVSDLDTTITTVQALPTNRGLSWVSTRVE